MIRALCETYLVIIHEFHHKIAMKRKKRMPKTNENQEDCNNPIADNVEEISTCDISIGPANDELTIPGPSRTAKRRRMC